MRLNGRFSWVFVFLLLAALPGAPLRAEEEGAREEGDRSIWLGDRAYERGEDRVLPGSGATVEVHIAAKESAPEEIELAWYGFLRKVDGSVVASYLVDRVVEDDGRVRLDLLTTSTPGALAWERVASTAVGADGDVHARALEFLDAAIQVEERWKSGSQALREVVATEDLDARRARSLTVTRGLERLRDELPWHAGVLRDLLVAYQVLLPLEAGTDRGANVSFLWRERLGVWLQSSVDSEEDAYGRLLEATCAFAEGCYALSVTALLAVGEEFGEDADWLRQALAAVGQAEQEVVVAGEEVTGPAGPAGPTGTLALTILACAAEPPGAASFNRRTYLTRAADGAPVTLPVWFSLTQESFGGITSWTLFGWVGGSRRVLRLYGSEEPDAEPVDELVRGVIRGTVAARGGR